jgi:hypothetical protein
MSLSVGSAILKQEGKAVDAHYYPDAAPILGDYHQLGIEIALPS